MSNSRDHDAAPNPKKVRFPDYEIEVVSDDYLICRQKLHAAHWRWFLTSTFVVVFIVFTGSRNRLWDFQTGVVVSICALAGLVAHGLWQARQARRREKVRTVTLSVGEDLRVRVNDTPEEVVAWRDVPRARIQNDALVLTRMSGPPIELITDDSVVQDKAELMVHEFLKLAMRGRSLLAPDDDVVIETTEVDAEAEVMW